MMEKSTNVCQKKEGLLSYSFVMCCWHIVRTKQFGVVRRNQMLVFQVKDMSEASYVPGVRIIRNRIKKLLIWLQEDYIFKILKRF